MRELRTTGCATLHFLKNLAGGASAEHKAKFFAEWGDDCMEDILTGWLKDTEENAASELLVQLYCNDTVAWTNALNSMGIEPKAVVTA